MSSTPDIGTRIVAGPRLKYLGLTLVLAWHYCLWFVPNSFPGMFILDDRVTFAWLIALASTVVTVLVLALWLGRKRHLSKSPVLLWSVALCGSAATIALTMFSARHPGVAYGSGVVIGVSAGFLWILWGEQYARQRAGFTMRRISLTYGLTLLVGLGLASLLPSPISTVLVSLLPLGSAALLWLSWRKAPGKGFPPVLPKTTARKGFISILTLCGICLIAALVSYFTVAIVDWKDLWWGAGESFTYGVAIGAVFVILIGFLQYLFPSRSIVFRLFPWLVFFSIIACLLYVLGSQFSFLAFLLALAISSVFEVLLIIYMANLTLRGYTSSATSFGLSALSTRLGICLGNGLALVYERVPGLSQAWTVPTFLAFIAILAGLTICLIRQEYAIQDLVRSPENLSDLATMVTQIAQDFQLSEREQEIVTFLGRGYTATAIAEKLVISPHTVNTHVHHIYDKLGIHKRSDLLDYLNKR